MYSRGTSQEPPCPFFTLPNSRIIIRNNLAIATRDACPVTQGRSLVIPARNVGSFFDVTPAEREVMLTLLDAMKLQPQAEYSPAGYNIGINDGGAAGQRPITGVGQTL